MYDILVVGAGVTGCSVARYLARYDAKVLVVEKAEDVCSGTSKANSALVHAGFDAPTGSLMARLNVRGSELMGPLCEELDVPFKRTGALVVCTDESEAGGLETLLRRGEANGVQGLEIIDREQLVHMEPNVSDAAVGALWAPSAGLVCPFILTVALAENAVENGAEFLFDSEVEDIVREEDGTWTVLLANGEKACARCVVNAAGVHADAIHNMVSGEKIHIQARRGEYYLLDKTVGDYATHTVFALPNKMGKGVLVTPTVHGNILVGPNAQDLDDKQDVATTSSGLSEVAAKSAITMRGVPLRQAITNFSGLRAVLPEGDFRIGEVADAPLFFDCAGICSPGLSAAPAIGEMVSDIIASRLGLGRNEGFVPIRKGILNPQELSLEERNELIARDPRYGTVVCRCETVTEGEIVDAIRRPVGARSLDGVKRRVRAGMGRCQAGFCSPRVMEILAREIDGMRLEDVTKSGGDSRIVVGRMRQIGGDAR